jgi:hypothetical protein
MSLIPARSANTIRKFGRNAETDSLLMLEDVRVEATKGR